MENINHDQIEWQAASDRTDAALAAYREACGSARPGSMSSPEMAVILDEVEAAFAAFAELCRLRGGAAYRAESDPQFHQ